MVNISTFRRTRGALCAVTAESYKKYRHEAVFLFGRASETRTHDLFVPNEARYQLRYSPMKWCDSNRTPNSSQGTGESNIEAVMGRIALFEIISRASCQIV
jgi:hypothetical protein